jgi:hypothetical protein
MLGAVLLPSPPRPSRSLSLLFTPLSSLQSLSVLLSRFVVLFFSLLSLALAHLSLFRSFAFVQPVSSNSISPTLSLVASEPPFLITKMPSFTALTSLALLALPLVSAGSHLSHPRRDAAAHRHAVRYSPRAGPRRINKRSEQATLKCGSTGYTFSLCDGDNCTDMGSVAGSSCSLPFAATRRR